MHTFKVSPGTQVSDSWTINELLHCRGKMSRKNISYSFEIVWGYSGKRKENAWSFF